MSITTSVASETLSETELLHIIASLASENRFPLAVWKLPSSDVRHLILAQQHNRVPKDAQIEEMTPGFMFAPFDKEKDSYFLPADYIFSFRSNKLQPASTPAEIASIGWLNEQLRRDSGKPREFRFDSLSSPLRSTDQHGFITLVNTCIEGIERGLFEKIVPSRAREVALPDDFNIISAFRKLCDNYPEALVSFVSIPGVGSWLGATPETLVSVEDKTIFKTVALAGTQPYREGTDLRQVAWNQKEIEEQALVERYIISCFKKIRLREYEEYGPKTVVAGNVMHLKTDFRVDMKATNFPQLGTVMLKLLHPTSAVCGMPFEPALEFLRQHEGYDREFYAGYLGPVNIGSRSDLFVNLRCMQLFEKRGILYSGAGVTIDSIPEQEWEETEIKMNTLLKVLF